MAVTWFRKAAGKGAASAQFNLGLMHASVKLQEALCPYTRYAFIEMCP